MTIYPKPGHQLLYTPMTGEIKCPIGYTFALRIPFHLLQCWCNTCTNHITNDMIHFISSRNLVGSSILTSLAFHRCLRPSAPSLCSSFTATWSVTPKPSTCPSHLQPVHQAKPYLDLLHLATWLHVMSHLQWAPSSHVWALQHFKAISISMARVAHTNVPVD